MVRVPDRSRGRRMWRPFPRRGQVPVYVIPERPSSHLAASQAEYVMIRSAPARLMEVSISRVARVPSIHSFAAAACHHRILTAHVVSGQWDCEPALCLGDHVEIGEGGLDHHHVGPLVDVGLDFRHRFRAVFRRHLVGAPIPELRRRVSRCAEWAVECRRIFRRVAEYRRGVEPFVVQTPTGWPPPGRPSWRREPQCWRLICACETAILASNGRVWSLSTLPSFSSIPQWPWEVYSHRQTSVITASSGNCGPDLGNSPLHRLVGVPRGRTDIVLFRWQSK